MMATLLKIPLLPETSDQVLNVELGGRPYLLRVIWNERFGYFSLSISEVDNTPILTNVKMVKNYNLTGRYKNALLPAGDLFFVQEHGKSVRPLYDDIGVNFSLYYFEDDALPAVPLTLPQSNQQLRTVWDDDLTTWDDGETVWDV